jgi:hypothetical protein
LQAQEGMTPQSDCSLPIGMTHRITRLTGIVPPFLEAGQDKCGGTQLRRENAEDLNGPSNRLTGCRPCRRRLLAFAFRRCGRGYHPSLFGQRLHPLNIFSMLAANLSILQTSSCHSLSLPSHFPVEPAEPARMYSTTARQWAIGNGRGGRSGHVVPPICRPIASGLMPRACASCPLALRGRK